MTPDKAAGHLADAWLSEMWPTCPELSRGERMAKRESDAVQQAQLAGLVVDECAQQVERGAA
jgi:hypothetical protein